MVDENKKEAVCDIKIQVAYRKVKLNDPRFKITGEILPLKERPALAASIRRILFWKYTMIPLSSAI